MQINKHIQNKRLSMRPLGLVLAGLVSTYFGSVLPVSAVHGEYFYPDHPEVTHVSIQFMRNIGARNQDQLLIKGIELGNNNGRKSFIHHFSDADLRPFIEAWNNAPDDVMVGGINVVWQKKAADGSLSPVGRCASMIGKGLNYMALPDLNQLALIDYQDAPCQVYLNGKLIPPPY